MNILIVDDSQDVRGVLMQLLREQGHAVREAVNGQEGLDRAREQRPDAIICDGLMPLMDGFQLLQALRKEPALSSIPFIFHSSVYTGQREQDLARSLGADAFLVKPQTPDAILQAIRDVTAGWKAAARTKPALSGNDSEFAREYSRVVATALEEKVEQFERVTRDLERTKKEIQKSEVAYRGLFENNPQPMWVYALETLAFLAVNDAAIISYGFSREEFLAMTIKDIRRPEDVQKLISRVSAAADGFDAVGVWKHRKKDGTIIDVEISSHALEFSGQRAKLILANDVTERTRLEKTIRHAADEWRDTFDAMTEGVALLDADGRIMRCNRAMALLMKKPFSEIVGQACAEMCACFGGSREGCPFLKSKKTLKREAVVFKQGGRWFEASADPIVDETGALQAAVHILQEITDRKQLEDTLKAAVVRAEDEKAKTESIIAGIGDGITIQDRDFKILYQNQAAKNMIGDHVGELCYMAYEKRDQKCEGCGVAQVFKDGGTHVVERSALTDKGLLYAEITASPLRDSKGNIIAGIEVVHNITERRRAEESLREQQRFTENLIMNSAIATFVLDASHKVLIWNKACEELTGIPALAIIGTKDQWKAFYEHERPVLADIVLGQEPEKLSSFYESFSLSTLTQDGIHAEGWFKNLNNRDRYIVFDAAPIRDGSGKIIAAVETLQDFTERKKLEEQIFRATQDWEYTFNSITDMVTVHDADYNIILANKAAEKILNLPILEKMKERKCFAYYHGTNHAPEGCPSCGCLQTGVSASFEIFEPHLGMFIEIRAIPRFDSEGKLIGLIHVVRDITEKKKAEDAIERYNKQLTALNTASNSLMASTSLADIYQKICDIIITVFDVKMVWLGIIEEGSYLVRPVAHAGEAAGYLDTITVTWDDSLTGRGPTGEAIRTGKPVMTRVDDVLFAPWRDEAMKHGYRSSMAVPLQAQNGTCIGALNFYSGEDSFSLDSMRLTQIFANQAAVAIDNARLVAGLETKVFERTRALEDTNTELQTVNKELVLRREEADAASRSKTDFLANMSHELRTPLNAIMGFSEIMLMDMAGPVSDKQREFLGDISKSGNHLLSMINDILDLSKVEAGKMELELGQVIVGELISGSLMMFKEKALKHSIKMETFIDPAVPQLVADRRKLKQVLVNLLSNAFKFTSDGGKVIVAARRTSADIPPFSPHLPRGDRGGDFIEFSVSDSGYGIEPEHQRKLFQPFMQIDSSLTRKHAGTGLGLSLCRRFVELHGGRIWVESELGKGSTFRFLIPVRRAPSEAQAAK